MKKNISILGFLFASSFGFIVAQQQDFSVSYTDKGQDAKSNTYDPMGITEWKPSKQNDNTYDIKKPRMKTVIPYRFLREEDILYRVKVTRELSVNEKINLPFRYNIDEDNGNQRFIMLLLKGIKDKKIKAYSPVDDRFTEELSYQDVTDITVGKPYTIQVTDWSDPSGNTKKDSVVIEEFDPALVENFRIKEEWVFDIAGGQLYNRILGIAPLKNSYNADGSYRDKYVLFWVYYPKCREYFGTLEAYSSNNLAYRNTWEEIWESKYYSSYIVKSSIQNPHNQNINAMYKDKIMQLVEADRIKNEIFNFEQNAWSY